MKFIAKISTLSYLVLMPFLSMSQICQEAYAFQSQEPNGGSFFGFDVVYEDDRIISSALGAVNDDGRVYVLDWDGSQWNESTVYASDVAFNDRFGWDIDLLGDRMIVGSYRQDEGGTDAGAAYIFDYDGILWNETKLQASDLNANDRFGESVDLDVDQCIVGAPQDENGFYHSGSAYIYEWDGTDWNETKLTPSNSIENAGYGSVVDIEGDRAIVGGRKSGPVTIFEKSSGIWTEVATLTNPQGSNTSYGSKLAMWGDRIIVGAPSDPTNGGHAGAAFLYEFDGTNWNETSFYPSDAAANDSYGVAVEIYKDQFIVGSSGQMGDAYLYTFNGSTWDEQKIIPNAACIQNSEFGTSVGLYEGKVVVGDYRGEPLSPGGSIHIYNCNSTSSNLKVQLNWLVDESCNNACNGALDLCALGGTKPYTYLWSDGNSAGSAANLCPGTYSLTVTDNNGDSLVTNYTIQAADIIIDTIDILSASDCITCNGLAEVIVTNNNPPYTYAWSNGANTSSFNQFCPGTYSVTVTDTHGCTADQSVLIPQSSQPTADAGIDKQVCFGETLTLGGSPTASNGAAPYIYDWSNGLPPIPNPVIFPSIGIYTYTVTITDANGCISIDQVSITNFSNPIASAGPDIYMCPEDPFPVIGGSPTAKNGTPPYIYSWSNALQSVANPTAFSPGTYNVTVTDANGCTSTDQTIIYWDAAATNWYYDGDGDGYGNNNQAYFGCTALPSYVQVGFDCNDNDPNISTIGAPCNDGLSCTSNTTVQADCTCGGVPVNTVTNTFTGNGNQWTDASNWSLGIVPDYCHNVIIPGGKFVVLISGELGKCNTLIVDQNSFLNIPPSANFEAVCLYQQ